MREMKGVWNERRRERIKERGKDEGKKDGGMQQRVEKKERYVWIFPSCMMREEGER